MENDAYASFLAGRGVAVSAAGPDTYPALDASVAVPAGRAQDSQSRVVPASPRRTRVSARTLPALCPDSPRLLTLDMGARYLGISYSVFRRFVFAGEIRAVRLPSSRRPGRESRRVYVDRVDLDRFVDAHKD